MSAPVLDDTPPAADIPEDAAPIVLPVMVIEGLETSDHRYIEPGTVEVRDLPIPLYAATRSTHGDTGDAATWHVGAITHAERIPGPEAELYGGATLPEGTFVWVGRGWMYKDVPAAPSKSAYQLVKDRALRGNSVDMTEVVAEFQGPNGELADQSDYSRISMQRGVVAATTLVGIPAFAGAYIKLDGTVPEFESGDGPRDYSMTAAAPPWLSADIGDLCHGCQVEEHVWDGDLNFPGGAGNGLQASTTQALQFDDDSDPPAQDFSTSGMVALVPANPQMLVAPGGDPASELHLTLAYLGDEVDQWEPDMVAAVHHVARRLTDFEYAMQDEADRMRAAGQDPAAPNALPSMSRSQPQDGPLHGGIFAHAVFNPNNDNGHSPATVYLLDGSGDRDAIEWLRNDVVSQVRNAIGDVNFPDQRQPFVPHVTAGYGLSPDQVTYTGPVQFDRIRVAIGDDVTDYPLGGGDAMLVASAADLPPVEWFEDPKLTEPTPLTVTDDGRVFGHMAAWGTCHTGFADQCKLAPRSASNYAYFRVHGCRARTADGEAVTVPVGYASVSSSKTSGGHAPIRRGMSVEDVAAHYDNTCTAAMELAVGEDDHGIWVAGRLMPGIDADTEYKARGAALSGDWRKRRGSLELVAALAVNSPGFPVPFRALVASGEPVALVAAGYLPHPDASPEEKLTVLYGLVQDATLSELADLVPSLEEQQAYAEADMLLTLEADHPWFNLDEVELLYSGHSPEPAAVHTYARGKKLHLPPYIRRIKSHLQRKGMTESHAIASAVNAAKKMCSDGDLNFPGHQDVNPGSRAEACAAVAQWKADRPGATD